MTGPDDPGRTEEIGTDGVVTPEVAPARSSEWFVVDVLSATGDGDPVRSWLVGAASLAGVATTAAATGRDGDADTEAGGLTGFCVVVAGRRVRERWSGVAVACPESDVVDGGRIN
ncbi:MAG: hypothetical protein U0172_06215 [Nitrospiraceae bacterium]